MKAKTGDLLGTLCLADPAKQSQMTTAPAVHFIPLVANPQNVQCGKEFFF